MSASRESSLRRGDKEGVPQLAIPTPAVVNALLRIAHECVADKQVALILAAMHKGEHVCEALPNASVFKREVYARMRDSGWYCHLDSCPTRFRWRELEA